MLRRRHVARVLFHQPRTPTQGEWLVAKHPFNNDVASLSRIECMPSDQVAAFGDNLIGILHDLELLATILPVQPHALADHFQDVDDTERSVAFVRAELAMIGMIDRNQSIDGRVACCLELVKLQLALERGKHADTGALQADCRLLQVDEFNARNCPQDFSGGFHHAGYAGMSVQRDPHFDPSLQVRLQLSEPAVEEPDEWRHLERSRAKLSLDRRQCQFCKLDVAARAPGDYLTGLGARQLFHRARAHAPGHLDVARAQLHDAATMARSAHDLVSDAEHIHDIEGKQRDMRRLEHIAASVKYEVRRLCGRRYRCRFLTQPFQYLAIELQTREHRHITAEIA